MSLAAGRPYEEFFDIAALHRYLDAFRRHLRDDLGHEPEQVRRTLLQYGRTKGIVHDLIARNLAVDEGITVDPEAVVVTVGCQEAMFLVLRALRAGPARRAARGRPDLRRADRRGPAGRPAGVAGRGRTGRGRPGRPVGPGARGPGRRGCGRAPAT